MTAPQPPERWQGPPPTTPLTPLSDDERKAWLAQQVDEHLRYGWQVESRTENLASLRRGKPINHVLHLLITLLSCFLWVPVWIGLAIFAGEKRKTISTRDADRPPQVMEEWYRRPPVIVAGIVVGFFIVMAIIGSLTS